MLMGCVRLWRRASDLCSFGTVCCPLEMALARYVQTYRVFKIHILTTMGAVAIASALASLTKVLAASTSRLQQQEHQQMISCRSPFTICESAHQNQSNVRIEQRSPQQQVPH
jgi:hypothetical protein